MGAPTEPTFDAPEAPVDVTAMADRIGASLFSESDPPEPAPSPPTEPAPVPPPPSPPPAAQASTEPLPVPDSWKESMADYWPKLDRKVQEYYLKREGQMLKGLEEYKQHAEFAKPFLQALQPYHHLFAQRPPHEMVASLLRAQQLLTEGSVEDRRKAYRALGENLRLLEEGASGTPPGQAPASEPSALPPGYTDLSTKLSALEQVVQAQQAAEYQQAYDTAAKSVEAFAADTAAHPYFNDVAADLLPYLQQGMPLPDAYEAAVWANSAVRAKEQARLLTEHEAKLKEKARLEALPKRKAAGVNVRDADADGVLTEPIGSIDDTIRNTLRAIRARAS